MIELTDTEADDVLGVRISKKITSRDLDVAMNFLNQKIRTRGRVSLYIEADALTGVEWSAISTEFRHALRQIEHLPRIRRVAIVTDGASVGHRFGLENVIPKIRVKRFSTAERDEARRWAAEREVD